MTMRHYWWHRPRDGYYAVATDEAGQIVSAWLQVSRHEWEPLDDFTPLHNADQRGEIHRNPHGYTDELGPSLGALH